MSDTDDGGFDKEAEREKLRQKFEEEEESRRATQQMSELLLKGATMTNHHCGECGNPIFRQDGQAFCPTCGEAVGEDGNDEPIDVPAEAAEGAEASAPGRPEEGADAGGESRAPSQPSETPDRAGEPTKSPHPAGDHDRESATRPGGSPRARSGERGSSESEADEDTTDGREATRSGGRTAGDLGEARASLVRTLTGLARRAEEAGDVRRTRDLLEAAREAAEALEALDRADR